MELQKGMSVYHKKIYNGRQIMKITDIDGEMVELEGDYSGGLLGVCLRDWVDISGVLTEKNETYVNELLKSLVD